jgi:hypothetical protein
VVTNGVSFDRNFKEIVYSLYFVFIVAPDHFERIKEMVHRLFCPSAQLARALELGPRRGRGGEGNQKRGNRIFRLWLIHLRRIYEWQPWGLAVVVHTYNHGGWSSVLARLGEGEGISTTHRFLGRVCGAQS